ncbi:Panacea domain-containing protein [Flavobacterium sp. RHBU_3]|uniref:Panacea domain-containing protein n=1 Tax=Flavobacterium sp. RHBU_3 TaxID=3391184 RepID=UPI0039851C31
MESVNAVANEFLKLAEQTGKQLTNLQLAKLCYIAQGFSLAILNQKAFPDAIEAWKFGPVVPSLYHEFKHFQSEPITSKSIVAKSDTEFVTPEVKDENIKKVVAVVWNVYRDVSGGSLVSLTHQGNTPWSLSYEPNRNKVISDDLIKRYYTKFVGNLEQKYIDARNRTA